MLPAAARLRRRSDFGAVTSAGARVGGRLLTVHVATPPPADPAAPARVGLVVRRSVGTAVVRNRVRRRLRHLLRDRLDRLPTGSRLVVRVADAAGAASSNELGRALDSALERVRRPAGSPRVSG